MYPCPERRVDGRGRATDSRLAVANTGETGDRAGQETGIGGASYEEGVYDGRRGGSGGKGDVSGEFGERDTGGI